MLNDKVMVVREAGAGSVVAYNYFDESILGGGSGIIELGANAAHWIGSHHVLFEGNWSYAADSDPGMGTVHLRYVVPKLFIWLPAPRSMITQTPSILMMRTTCLVRAGLTTTRTA